MPLIPNDQNLFIVDLHYVEPLEKIDPEVDAHIAFLDQNYASGTFIASGAKVPRNGGVIIATAASREALEVVLASDPFHAKKLARYTITEFRPTKTAPQLMR